MLRKSKSSLEREVLAASQSAKAWDVPVSQTFAANEDGVGCTTLSKELLRAPVDVEYIKHLAADRPTSINIGDVHGRTAVHYCTTKVHQRWPQQEMLEHLLLLGGNIGCVSADGCTPIRALLELERRGDKADKEEVTMMIGNVYHTIRNFLIASQATVSLHSLASYATRYVPDAFIQPSATMCDEVLIDPSVGATELQFFYFYSLITEPDGRLVLEIVDVHGQRIQYDDADDALDGSTHFSIVTIIPGSREWLWLDNGKCIESRSDGSVRLVAALPRYAPSRTYKSMGATLAAGGCQYLAYIPPPPDSPHAFTIEGREMPPWPYLIVKDPEADDEKAFICEFKSATGFDKMFPRFYNRPPTPVCINAIADDMFFVACDECGFIWRAMHSGAISNTTIDGKNVGPFSFTAIPYDPLRANEVSDYGAAYCASAIVQNTGLLDMSASPGGNPIIVVSLARGLVMYLVQHDIIEDMANLQSPYAAYMQPAATPLCVSVNMDVEEDPLCTVLNCRLRLSLPNPDTSRPFGFRIDPKTGSILFLSSGTVCSTLHYYDMRRDRLAVLCQLDIDTSIERAHNHVLPYLDTVGDYFFRYNALDGAIAAYKLETLTAYADNPVTYVNVAYAPLRQRTDDVVKEGVDRGQFVFHRVPAPDETMTIAFCESQVSLPTESSNALFFSAVRTLLARFSGYEVNCDDRTMMVAFSNLTDAANWSLCVQLFTAHIAWPEEVTEKSWGAPVENLAADTFSDIIPAGISLGVARSSEEGTRWDIYASLVNMVSLGELEWRRIPLILDRLQHNKTYDPDAVPRSPKARATQFRNPFRHLWCGPRVRIGFNQCTPYRKVNKLTGKTDFSGSGVKLAAAVTERAKWGEVCIPATTFEKLERLDGDLRLVMQACCLMKPRKPKKQGWSTGSPRKTEEDADIFQIFPAMLWNRLLEGDDRGLTHALLHKTVQTREVMNKAEKSGQRRPRSAELRRHKTAPPPDRTPPVSPRLTESELQDEPTLSNDTLTAVPKSSCTQCDAHFTSAATRYCEYCGTRRRYDFP